MELSEQDLARIVRVAVRSAISAAVPKARTTSVLSGTVEQVDAEDLGVAFVRMDGEAISGDPTQSQNYEEPGVIPTTRLGQTYDGEQVRVDFNGAAGASAMQTSAEKKIVLPYGVEDGQRIEIDGEAGRIEIYNDDDEVVGRLRPLSSGGSISAISPGGPSSRLVSSSAAAFLELTPDPWTGHTLVTAANIASQIDGAGEQARITVVTPQHDSLAYARVFMNSEDDSGGPPSFFFDSSDGSPTEFKVDNREIPRGIIRQFTADTDQSFPDASGDADSDMVLNNVPVVAGRTYGIHLHVRLLYAVITATARWLIRLRLNGANFDVFEDFEPGFTTAAGRKTIDSWVYWTPSVTASTDDLLVHMDENANGMSVTFEASATSLRTLTLHDFGVL